MSMMVVPTQEMLLSHTVDHLVEGAQHWDQTARQWSDTFGHVFASARAAEWSGAAAEAMHQRAAWDWVMAEDQGRQLNALAGIAREHAQQLTAAKNDVVHALDAARQDFFSVGQDWSVTDQLQYPEDQRQQLASQHAQALSSRVQAFSTAESRAAQDLAQAGSRVRMVDWSHPLHDPAGGPKPMPKPLPSCGEHQEDLWRNLLSSIGVGAIVGGVMAGSATDGVGAPQGALYGALGGGLTYLLKEAITGTPNCG